jgi:prephenate dehydrogenase
MAQQSLGIIGVGAFGAFMAQHLAPHFALTLCDNDKKVGKVAKKLGAVVGDLTKAAACDIVIVAVPVQKMETVLRALAPKLHPGTLVLDVGSVKIKPTQLMKKILPKHVDIIGTHPLFGPQSDKNGIQGLKIAVSNIRGKRGACVSAFLKKKLKLAVYEVTPQQHDKELAYVHGLTHMLAKVIASLGLPKFNLTTKTYDLFDQAVEFVRYDSDELFRAIERENPHAKEAKKAFFASARKLEERLTRN